MKITHIRLRKLVSTDRYGHVAVELEAQLQPDDDYEASLQALQLEVNKQLHTASEIDRLSKQLPDLQERVTYLERQRDGLRDDIAENRKIIREHSQLGEIARDRGIDIDGLNGEIPF